MENKKKITALSLASSYCGYYLGAGYLSGQELWQFFGVYGKAGIFGLLLSVISLGLLGALLFRVTKLCGKADFKSVVIRFDLPIARAVFAFLEIFFTFAVFVVMSAGGGALFQQVMGLPRWIGSFLFCAAVTAATFRGLDGMLRALSALVPVLTALTLFVALLAAIKNGGAPIELLPASNTNPLLNGWLISALTYLSYNFFGAVCVFPQLADRATDSTVRRAMCISCAVLGSIAFSVFAALAMNPDSVSAQLPMLSVAAGINPYLGYICSVPLFFGMFGTSLTAMVAVTAYGEQRSALFSRRRGACIVLLGALCWLGSLFGFSRLIGILYPVCGYIGLISILLLIEHRLYLARNAKQKPSDG